MENYSLKIFNLNMDQEKRAKNLIKYLSTLPQSYFVNHSLEDLITDDIDFTLYNEDGTPK